jgi:hypothetical protein
MHFLCLILKHGAFLSMLYKPSKKKWDDNWSIGMATGLQLVPVSNAPPQMQL